MQITQIQDGHLIFNTVRAGLSENFQKNIPAATKETLRDIGMILRPEGITEHLWNEWIGGLVNVIGLEMIETTSIENELEPKLNKSMPFGDLIRHYAVQPAKGRDFRVTPNMDWSNPYYVYNPTVLVEYHRKNFRMQWYNSTFWDLASKAFDSNSGMSTLITYIIESLYQGRNNDVYQAQKEILNTYMTNTDWPLKPYQRIQVPALVDEVSARALINSVKNMLTAWRRTTGDFNLEGLVKQVRSGDVDVFIRQEVMNYLETETWYAAFNRGDLAFTPGTGNTATPSLYFLDNFGGIYAQAPSADDPDVLVDIYPVYSTRQVDLGMVIGWAYMEGSTTPVANLEPTNWVDPHANVLMIIAEKSLMLGARSRQDFNTTRNNTGRYDTHVLYEELALGYNGFANACVIEMLDADPTVGLAAAIAANTQNYTVDAIPRQPDSEETTKTMSSAAKKKLAEDVSTGKEL